MDISLASDVVTYRIVVIMLCMLTIPEWLNEIGYSMVLNFSQLLLEALFQKVQPK